MQAQNNSKIDFEVRVTTSEIWWSPKYWPLSPKKSDQWDRGRDQLMYIRPRKRTGQTQLRIPVQKGDCVYVYDDKIEAWHGEKRDGESPFAIFPHVSFNINKSLYLLYFIFVFELTSIFFLNRNGILASVTKFDSGKI